MSNNRDKFFSIACIDYRYDALVADFYAAINEKPNYYLGTAAGAALPLGINGYSYKYGGCVTEEGKNTNQILENGLLTNFEISQTLSNIKKIDLMDHQDCGAFKVFLPCSGYPENLGEKKRMEKNIHKKVLLEARSALFQRYPELVSITMRLIDVNGSVGELNPQTGEWSVIYVGRGTNPKGLWF